jgi:Flp pilus assembly protein TadD
LAEESGRRENLFDLVRFGYDRKDWALCRWAALRALQVTTPPTDFATTAEAWGYLLHDFLAIASFYLGCYGDAHQHGQVALRMNPTDSRLRSNLDFYESKVRETEQ